MAGCSAALAAAAVEAVAAAPTEPVTSDPFL